MKMDVFAEMVRAAVEERLGSGFHAEAREVRKNNGILRQGLLIFSEGQKVVPTIYLESFLEAYESGTPFGAVVAGVLSVYGRDVPKDSIDMEFFQSFGKVKDRICYRLVGRAGNKGLLEDLPHVEFLDLAICFYYAYDGSSIGEGSVPIYNSHVEMWETSVAELLELARENTPRLFPWECRPMDELLEELTGIKWEDGDGDMGSIFTEMPMKVLGNVKRTHGAACILYPGVLEGIAGDGKNLFIIPSSIHETILVPDTGRESRDELKRMISEVNSTQVPPEEVLSDSLYYYDARGKKIVIA